MNPEDIAYKMTALMDDYYFWVLKLEKDKEGNLTAREGYNFEDCMNRMAKMPQSGNLEDMRLAIVKARAEENNEPPAS